VHPVIERSNPHRLNELEESFAALEPRLRDGPEKDAISLLHAMLHELRRGVAANTAAAAAAASPAPVDVANLYKQAPRMGGTAQNTPLPVGSPAPGFTLKDANGQQVSLADFRGALVVLVFYPLDWSPTCSDQLSLYQSEIEEFRQLGATLIGISVDSLYSHGAWAAVRGITFPLLADFEPKGAVARSYQAYREGDGFSERALYVVDGEGVIRYAHIAPQLDHVPDIEELFSVLRSLQPRREPVTV
jgi:peroxiredoxin